MTVAMIGRYLTPELQGYFFTLTSLVAWQAVLELGLNQTIVHFASHEMAGLCWNAQARLEGSEAARQRLASLFRFSLQWFGVGGLLLIAVFIPVGSVVLRAGAGSGPEGAAALTAWMLMVPMVALNLLGSAAFSLLEGCGKVTAVALGRLTQSIAAALALWAGLA